MHAIFQRGRQQIAAALHERRQQQHGVLNIGYRVRPRILRRQHAPGFFGSQRFIRDRQQQRPLPFRNHAGNLRFALADILATANPPIQQAAALSG